MLLRCVTLRSIYHFVYIQPEENKGGETEDETRGKMMREKELESEEGRREKLKSRADQYLNQ